MVTNKKVIALCFLKCNVFFYVGMASKSALDVIETSTKVHFSGLHQKDGLDSTRSEQIAEEEEEHGEPFVIGKRRLGFVSLPVY